MYSIKAVENNFPMTQVMDILANHEENHESAGV
jgi:hypothetical protein